MHPQSEFRIGGTSVASVGLSEKSITVHGGLSTPFLHLDIDLDLRPYEHNDLTFTLLTGTISIGNSHFRHQVGAFSPVQLGLFSLNATDRPIHTKSTLSVRIDEQAIDRLERKFAGDLVLGIDLQLGVLVTRTYRWIDHKLKHVSDTDDLNKHPKTLFDQYVLHPDYPLSITVSRQYWRDTILPKLGYGKFVVFEIPIAQMASDDRIARAMNRLEAAQQHFRRGEYHLVISRCRLVLEPLFKDRTGKSVKELSKEWRDAFGDVTFTYLKDSMHILDFGANAYNHDDGNANHDMAIDPETNKRRILTRLEAQTMLVVTASLLAFFSQTIAGDSIG